MHPEGDGGGGAPPERGEMRVRLFALLAVGALALGSAQAGAGTIPFVGALSISFQFVTQVSISATASGTAVLTTSGNHINALSIPASPFDAVGVGVPVMPPTAPAPNPIRGFQATFHNGAGIFADAPLRGLMPLNGVARLCLFRDCTLPVVNLTVPLTVVGRGGTATHATTMLSGTPRLSLTVAGAPWTAGTAAVGTITRKGFVHGPASGTSSTAAGSGAIRLVTPIFISTNAPVVAIISGFASLDLHFVPEPSTLLLLGGGIAGLVVFGRSKRG